MTRARDRLYIGGWGDVKDGNGSWYDLISRGLTPLLTEIADEDGMAVRRLESSPEKIVPDGRGAVEAEAAAEPLPAWARETASPERHPQPITPSRLATGPEEDGASFEPAPLGPQALARDARFTRGRLIHALLQYLPEIPEEAREDAARRFIAIKGAGLDAAKRAEIVSEALTVIRDPDVAPLFAAGSLAEVPIVARIGEGEEARELSGQIDRLAIREQDILVLDYKTNRPPPSDPADVSPIYIAQLAAYRLALSAMFPGKKIRTALLWTDQARLMEMPESLIVQRAMELLHGSQS